MGSGRSYGDACGTAHALDLIGERWSLLVVRELVLGAKRYSDLRTALPGISTNVLSTRLDELEAGGVVQRRRLPPPAASAVYELTDWGRDLEPVLCQLGRWAARSPLHDRTAHLSASSLVLSLRTNFDGAAAAGADLEVELHLLDETFVARVGDDRLTVERGVAERPAATLAAAPPVLASVIYGGRSLADAVASGDVTITGDERAARRFLGSFVLPEPVAAR
jgi:DNA-binding HxlR family transcriptional regulator